jgi:hypothetical protein
MNSIYKVLILPLIFGSSIALAQESGLFVEPGVTYETSDTDVDYPAPFGNSSGSVKGFGLMGRGGFHINEAFFVAADLRYSKPKFTDSSVDYDATADASNYGLAVGFQMPDIGLRVWGDYIFGGTLNPDSSSGIDVKFEAAKGFRVGAGFRIAAFSVNLEYQDLKYGDTKLEELGPFTSDTALSSTELRNKSYILSASFPLEL